MIEPDQKGEQKLNIAFYLTPKEEVIWIAEDSTMRQALEKMEYHRYSAMPLVNKEGKYAGTIAEGDLLWNLKRYPDLRFKDLHKVRIKVPKHQYVKHSLFPDRRVIP